MRKSKSLPAFKNRPKYAFVVDGKCEFWYIQMLQRNEKTINATLSPEIPQRKTLSDQYKRVIELSKDYDKVFWIIDFDTINSETRLAKKGNKTTLQEFKGYCEKVIKRYVNIVIVINNPCLEYWILLHFESTSKFYDNCEGATRQLKKYLPDYEKSQLYYTKQDNDIYLKLKLNTKKALSNSNKLIPFDFHNPHAGTSQMHLLFEKLFSDIDLKKMFDYKPKP